MAEQNCELPGADQLHDQPGHSTKATSARQTTALAERCKLMHTWLMQPAVQRDIASVTRNEVSPATVARVVVSNLKADPKLADCNCASLLNAVVTALSLGLEPDNVRGLAYLVPFKNNKAKPPTTDCVLIPGYMGYIQLGYRSSQIAAWHVPQIVYAGDAYSYSPAQTPPVTHHPEPPAKRGDKIAVYCRVDLTTGGSVWIWLWADDVMAHKARSRAMSGPWQTDEDAMWMKTACRVIRKFLPSSPTLQLAGALDDEAESDRDQSLYEITASIDQPDGQSSETFIEADLRKAKPDGEVVPNTDATPGSAAEPQEPTAAMKLDTLRRKVLSIWANLSPDQRASVAKSVDGLDVVNLMASFETMKNTTEIELLQAVLDTVPGA